MARDPLQIIDDIERVRTANNKNWMDLLRLAYSRAPEETKAIVKEIYRQDKAVSALVEELTRC